VNTLKRLQARSDQRPIAVAVNGAGFISKGLLHRLERTPGITTAIVTARNTDRATEIWEMSGRDEEVVVSDNVDVLNQAIADGRPVVAPSADVLGSLDGIDVVYEATGAIDHGAEVMLSALRSGRHVVSMNAEVDATIGHLLHDQAHRNGVVYTIADGDQPGAMLRQIDFVEGMGFEIAAALNCKGQLDVHQTPEISRQYATRDDTSILMTTAFGDGTKMQIENTVVANLSGLIPDKRGMHGVETDLAHAADDIANALSNPGRVEFTLRGDFKAGIGVLGTADDADMEMPYMRYLKMGDGPHYFFYRPYHLVHFEAAYTIAEAVLDSTSLGTPTTKRVAETITLAKQAVAKGTKLDGIGGAWAYGLIDTVEGSAGLLPVGLSGHATLTKDHAVDEPILTDNVELDDSALIVKLRAEQDALFT